MRVGMVQTPRHWGVLSEWRHDALPRGMALFLSAFGIINVLAGSHTGHFDGNLWWLDLRRLPKEAASVFILISALGLLGYAFHPPHQRWARAFIAACAAGLGVVALLNAGRFYMLLLSGEIATGFPLPISLLLVLALATIVSAAWRGTDTFLAGTRWGHGRTSLRIGLVSVGCAIAFAVLQMFCFGKTDYRRPAEVAVVLGARAYADGRPSDALADRVRTACQLYRQGLVRKLVFSGGPGDGAITEPEAMRRMAIGLGVNSADVTLDTTGLNTEATVKNTLALFLSSHPRVLVVSHFYHLPRVKLTYQRAGLDVYTVPAKETYLLGQTPYNIAREVAALWVYYLKAITGRLTHQ